MTKVAHCVAKVKPSFLYIPWVCWGESGLIWHVIVNQVYSQLYVNVAYLTLTKGEGVLITMYSPF